MRDVLRTPGAPLDAATRRDAEHWFGSTLDDVRVHTDARAAASAGDLGASAYTVGRHIVFGAGRFAPGTRPGRSLLAHELAHVEQWAPTAGALPPEQLALGGWDDPEERAAEQVARQVDGGWEREAARRRDAGGRALRLRPHPAPPAARRALRRSRGGFFSAIGGFFSSIFHGIFGFSDNSLRSYLQDLERTNDTEGDPDSDDKARAVVNKWMADRSAFTLTPKLKRLLIVEMLDGPTTKSDENAILDLLETSRDDDLRDIFAAGGATPKQLQSDLDADDESKRRLAAFFSRRFKGGIDAALQGRLELQPYVNLQAMEGRDIDAFIESQFTGADRDLARKILEDLRAVKGGAVDFENPQELRNEIFKRMRVSQLMQESQAGGAFGYPESMNPGDCPDYRPGVITNARVNKAARPYWTDVQLDPRTIYYFELTDAGRRNAYQALVSLFVPQASICDKTLFHCDYLTSVIQLRAFAESMGAPVFDERVRRRAIEFTLTYFGAKYVTKPSYPGDAPGPASAGGLSLQIVRPDSEADLVVGDKVIFWNHLAYDALTVKQPGPWRLENAVLVDKTEGGKDLFEGHGAPARGAHVVPGDKDEMLGELLAIYNRVVGPAIDLTRQVEEGYAGAPQRLAESFPQVGKGPGGKWVVSELERNSERRKRLYDLRILMSTADPELIGLRDPQDPSRMNNVERPVESQREPLPTGP